MGRTYALSDIHGMGDLWNQIKAYLQSDDKLYFLGDAADRGPDGFKIMQELLADPRVIYLMGNHEMLMANGLSELRFPNKFFHKEDFEFWAYYNGGAITYEAWEQAGQDFSWIKRLKNLPAIATYTNTTGKEIILCHAGFTPGNKPADTYDLVWDRHHFYDTVNEEKYPNTIVVHGHTPALLLEYRYLLRSKRPHAIINGACFYDNNHKIDIDAGAFATGKTVLLDLDTLEVISFETDIIE